MDFADSTANGLRRSVALRHLIACGPAGRPRRSSWLYVAAVVNLYARRIVGWSMKPSLARSIVLGRALDGGVETASAVPCVGAFGPGIAVRLR